MHDFCDCKLRQPRQTVHCHKRLVCNFFVGSPRQHATSHAEFVTCRELAQPCEGVLLYFLGVQIRSHMLTENRQKVVREYWAYLLHHFVGRFGRGAKRRGLGALHTEFVTCRGSARPCEGVLQYFVGPQLCTSLWAYRTTPTVVREYWAYLLHNCSVGRFGKGSHRIRQMSGVGTLVRRRQLHYRIL